MSIELDKTADDPDRDKKPTALTPGTQLGKYRLERILGEGGMGVVWAARDPDLQRSIAIKVIKHAGASAQLRQRLLREAVAMAKLKHPNVLTVYEVGTVADRDYIAMELVDGTSVDAWLAMGHPFEQVWNTILAAGHGLAAAHAAGVVHRDFKPHNVLRSRDGRVLVTDFGLARGILDESDASDGEHAPDSVLDTQLTHTGALIGTPAYMAPEQFEGAPPDPRTDQFAFCVTAWQAFTGDRPFKGNTLEEMKRAVSSGVAHLPAKLAGPIRGVLSRGLDPDPAKRWPSLEELLDALERAARIPARRRLLAAIAAAAVMAAVAVTFFMLRRPTPVANACDAPDRQFDEAWSPAVRATLARAVSGPGFERATAALDQFRARWVESYQRACRTKRAPVFAARIECLDGVRDQVSTLTFTMQHAPAEAYDKLDMPGLLPHLAGCDRTPPAKPVRLPTQEPLRTQVRELLARRMELLMTPPGRLAAALAQLEQDAAKVQWPPLAPMIVLASAHAALRAREIDKARDAYKRAKDLAMRQPDHRQQAEAFIGLLDVSMTALGDPSTAPLARLDDPKTVPTLHPELGNAIQTARDAAKDDPVLLGAIETSAALAYQNLAQFNRYRSAYTEALLHAQQARINFEAAGDARRMAKSAAIEATIVLERGDDRALDDAFFTTRRAADALTAAKRPPSFDLDMMRAEIAFLRRQYAEVHRLIDEHAPLQPSSAQTTISGRVTPAGRATVIAWRGSLVGDPRRGYTVPNVDDIDVIRTEPDGSFTIHAEPGWAVIAEAGDQRSLPRMIGQGALALTLQPTVTQSGTVAGKNLFGVRAFARYRAGESTWTLEVPVDADGTYDLRGMPQGGEPTFGTNGEAGHAQREVVATGKQLTWPAGQALEIIVRGDKLAGQDSVVVTSGDKDRAVADLRRVGASVTDVGREQYRPGDRHAIVTGNAPGSVTACVAETCRTVELQPSISIDYPDGRFAVGTTTLVLEP